MRFLFQVFLSFFILVFTPFELSAEEEIQKVIPITVGDLQRYQDSENGNDDFFDFLIDFYKRNKEIGATDTQILNEILKFDVVDGENSKLVKGLSLLTKRFKSMEEVADNAITELNLQILESYPGKTNKIIDLEKPSTWKNIKYIHVGDKKIGDYFRVFQVEKDYSNIVVKDDFEAGLLSCMDMGKERILSSVVLLPKKDNIVITQKEGEKPFDFKFDFSKSENLIFEPVSFPQEKQFSIKGKKFLGYDNITYLPFYVRPKNQKKANILDLNFDLNICQEDVCRVEKVSGIKYKIDKSFIESPSCSSLTTKEFNIPKNNGGKVTLKKAFFKKENNGKTHLFVLAKVPFFATARPELIIKNEQGLRFAPYFLSKKGNSLVFRVPLLNPEQLKETADLVFNISYSLKSSEFKERVSFEKSLLSSDSFSVIDCFKAFFLGVKFFLLTPLLTAFLVFMSQAILIKEKSFQKTSSFYKGFKKALSFSFFAFALLFLFLIYVLPEGVLFWGKHFSYPVLNFVFALLFLFIGINLTKIFDDTFIEKLPKIPFLKTTNAREKAGGLTGLTASLLLFITPMIGLYFDVYFFVLKSPVLYLVSFIMGANSLFILVSIFKEKFFDSERKPLNKKALFLLLLIPFLFQSVLLLTLLGIQVGLVVFLVSIGIFLLFLLLFLKPPASYLKSSLVVLFFLLFTSVPFHAGEYDLNNYGRMEFDEELLYKSVKEGKSVYLNVTENFCLQCQWNQLIMMYTGGPKSIKSKKLLIMGVPYNHPFLYRLLDQTYHHKLPLNLMFSPNFPEGKVIDSILFPWSARDAVVEAFKTDEPQKTLRQKIKEEKKRKKMKENERKGKG